MANRRMIPTSFFKDPDIMMLGKDAQLALIGLVLAADDYGRELAHADLLARQMNYTPEQMEAALNELVANDLLVLYQGGRHRYYSLTRWWAWQTIPVNRRVTSAHPAPPESVTSALSMHDASSVQTESIPTNSTLSAPRLHDADTTQTPRSNMSAQYKLSESNVSKENGGEEEALPSNVVPFPQTHTDDTTAVSLSQENEDEVTRAIATILKLPVNAALHRTVEDYRQDTTLSLFGEADAAREWIDDTRRNHKGQRMSPAFFRRWLKREHDDVLKRQATGTTGQPTQGPPPSEETPKDPYAAYLAQRVQEVNKRYPDLSTLEQQYQASATEIKETTQRETGQESVSR